MRPVKLVMSGFCSYGGKNTVIDFDKLGKNGLYLISGETGAGKTTIFDAISFALFGEASGTNRGANMLRSDFADENTPTEVELTFEYSGHTYCVKRNPTYDIIKTDGSKKNKTSDASLYKDGELICTRTTSVNAQIEEIIRLDKNQFSQIAMIAQGEFLKLINANTDERTAIFRKLFQTDKYKNIEDKLLLVSNTTKGEAKELRDKVKTHFESIECDEESTYYTDAEKVKCNGMLIEEAIKVIDSIIKEDQAKYESNIDNDKNNEKIIDEITIKLTEAETYEKNLKLCDEKKKSLEEAEANIKEANTALKDAESKKEDSMNAYSEAEKIKSALNKYDELDELVNTITNISRIISDSKTKKDNDEKSKITLTEKISKLETEIKTLKDADEILAKASSDLDKEKEKKKKLDLLGKDMNELDALSLDLEAMQKKFREAQNSANSAESEYNEANNLFLAEQAGIMASTLEDGNPCPVCGSIHHPNLAKKSEEAPSEAQLNDKKERADLLSKEAADFSSKAGELKGQLTSKEKAILENAKDLISANKIDEVKAKLASVLNESNNNINELEIKVDDANINANRKKAIEESLPAMRNDLDSMTKKISEIILTIASNEATLIEKENARDKTRKELKFENKNEAQKKIEELEKVSNDIMNAIDAAKKKVELVTASKERLLGEIKQLENLTKVAPTENEDELNCKLSEAYSLRTVLKNTGEELNSRIDCNSKALNNIKKISQELSRIESKSQWLEALSNTANGKIPGKEKMEFETYVQSTYFDRVIRRANIRLDTMTGGQYQLKRASTARNNRGKTGLDLNVIDHYTGKERDAKSLSGGESFKASLALALGLADEVTASAGGIKIDTMFIDEGFGSLDSESLEQAMRALSDLADSNRLVGIISHVDILEKRIDNKINVKKDSNGSSYAEIVLG